MTEYEMDWSCSVFYKIVLRLWGIQSVTELIVNLRVHFEIYKRIRENKINVYFREIINEDLC